MIDIHMHAIPGVDDGSQSIDESLAMIEIAYAQGIRQIIATPHSSAFGNTKKVIDGFEKLKKYVRQLYPDMILGLGSEILFTNENKNDNLNRLNSGELPSLNKTKYVLAEFHSDVELATIMNVIELLRKEGWITIIAHAERYGNVFANDHNTVLIKQTGAKIQLNMFSLSEETDTGIKETARRLISLQAVDFAGSDAHGSGHRSPTVTGGIAFLSQNATKKYSLDVLRSNAIRLLKMQERLIFDGLYGLAVADALGVPFESRTAEQMKQDPCTGMIGFGTHQQPAGTWSDDTSMTLCTADSLSKGFNPDDMMKKFADWRWRNAYTASGTVFDIGIGCRRAINKYKEGVPAELCGDSSINGNGNGALMRILPMALYQYRFADHDDEHPTGFLGPIHTASSLTHAHPIGLICCGLYALMLKEWLDNTETGKPLLDITRKAFTVGKAVYTAMGGEFARYINDPTFFDDPIRLLDRKAEDFPVTGYVLDSWNVALWCLLTTDNYRDCVLKAVNLGGDTDTNAAIAGSLAGIFYGIETIPAEWIDALMNKPLIDQIAERFAAKISMTPAQKATIEQFDGEYAFLSMKAPTQILLDEICYEDAGSAYYALSVPEEYRSQFSGLGSRKARKLYKELPHLESDCECIAERLYQVLKAKYEQHPEQAKKLVESAPAELIYDTSGSHDNILGRCRCKDCNGKDYKNLYGKALMKIRAELCNNG